MKTQRSTSALDVEETGSACPAGDECAPQQVREGDVPELCCGGLHSGRSCATAGAEQVGERGSEQSAAPHACLDTNCLTR